MESYPDKFIIFIDSEGKSFDKSQVRRRDYRKPKAIMIEGFIRDRGIIIKNKKSSDQSDKEDLGIFLSETIPLSDLRFGDVIAAVIKDNEIKPLDIYGYLSLYRFEGLGKKPHFNLHRTTNDSKIYEKVLKNIDISLGRVLEKIAEEGENLKADKKRNKKGKSPGKGMAIKLREIIGELEDIIGRSPVTDQHPQYNGRTYKENTSDIEIGEVYEISSIVKDKEKIPAPLMEITLTGKNNRITELALIDTGSAVSIIDGKIADILGAFSGTSGSSDITGRTRKIGLKGISGGTIVVDYIPLKIKIGKKNPERIEYFAILPDLYDRIGKKVLLGRDIITHIKGWREKLKGVV